MKHRPIRSFFSLPRARIRSALFVAFTALPLLFASGCALAPESPPAKEVDERVEAEPDYSSRSSDGDVIPDSAVKELPKYTVDEEELIYYGEVLAFRYGIDVSPDEWIHLAEQECTTFTDDQSTSVYGPAAADALDDDTRSDLLLETFVFVVVGTDMCDSGYVDSGFERFGSEAILISIAFLTTVIDTESLGFSVADFADYYDNQLVIARYDTSTPPEPNYSNPYDDYEENEIAPPEYPASPPEYAVPGPPVEHEGNAGGPTLCDDGTVSNSSGSGTCSHHGGEG